MRIGVGFDAHPFLAGRPLRLGGAEIPHPAGLSGHSDGDVLLHAVADAILGAAGLGSLGEYFPDDSEAWRGADSSLLLDRAASAAATAGYRVGNVDAVVVAESPRVAPHALRIRARLAEILGTEPARVSVRGTSSNGLGFPGRGEGIAAIAVVLLEETGVGSDPAGVRSLPGTA
ncbi:MAG TPA: 2-C-methyl-D-erythritol 2,4-cyclodiphosphate synthase [Thermoanaerobaculia bacterium]|nr:2-C-methyl-D-erythritol 2,4-cyclodiphosphate synthase [Thermoanaerobaculia bacterium]